MDVRNPSTATAIEPLRWTPGTPESVKHALENLHLPHVLELSPLTESPVISTGRSAAELRALLVDVVSELSDSGRPEDAEAGRLLLDYYVKSVGSHEVTMARLNLSRPTCFRRLKRGHALVADQLRRLSAFALWFRR